MPEKKPKHRIELLGQVKIALHPAKRMLVLQIPVRVDGSPNLVRVPLAPDEADSFIAMLRDSRQALDRIAGSSPKKH